MTEARLWTIVYPDSAEVCFSVNLRGSRAIGPRSLWRLGWTWALSLMLACVAAFAQDPANPTREYIRLGDRLIAIENIARQITIVPPTRNVIGPGETAQFGKTVSGIPPESVRWTVDSGPGTITSEGGLYQAPILVTAVQTATIRATSTADPSAVATSSITVNPFWCRLSNSVPANRRNGRDCSDQGGPVDRLIRERLDHDYERGERNRKRAGDLHGPPGIQQPAFGGNPDRCGHGVS